MRPTDIGALDQRLALEAPARTPDGGGGAIVTWETISDVWANVRTITGDERLRADQVTGRVTHVVTLRHRSDVTPAMRFRADPRLFEIVAVLDAGRHDRLRCLCEERYL